MQNEELSSSKTTSLVIDGLASFEDLNDERGMYDEKFLEQLTKTLKKSQLIPTELMGSYFHLHIPLDSREVERQVAVKLTDKTKRMYSSAKERMETLTTEQELQEVFDDGSFIRFDYLDKKTRISDLSEEEKVFVFLALEHKKYVDYYSPYILPAVFIAYKRDADLIGERVFDPETEEGEYFIEHLSALGNLTPDKREIVARKGDVVFAMVQDFVDLGPSVFKVDRTKLTNKRRGQIFDLADKIEKVFEETGYFPDESMASRSDNLCFTDNGKLVLIDTNHLVHRDHVSGASTHYLKKLRDIANNIPEQVYTRREQ